MPTNTKSRTERRVVVDDLGFAPALDGDERSEELANAGAARPPAGVVDEAVERAVERRRVRQALGMPKDRGISNELLDELLAGASTEEELAGPGGVLANLTKRLVERAMGVELTDHVGYEPHQEPSGGAQNQRNGTSSKTLITEHGQVRIDAPRDRDGSFEPRIVRKRQRRFVGFDDKILALYSRGLSTRDISAHLEEIYGVQVSRDLISKVTDAVMDDVREWAKRPLEDVYPIVFLDCMVLKIREGGTVQRRALYLALGVTLEGDPRRARHVVSRNGGREVLDAGTQRSEDPRGARHPDLLRRRADRVPGGDRGDLPAHDRPNLHCSSLALEPEIRAQTGA